jgi:hypothetical protein
MAECFEGCPVQKERLEGKSRIGQDPLHDEAPFGDEQPVSSEQIGIAEMSKRVEPGVARVGYRDNVHSRGESEQRFRKRPGRP